MFYPVKQFNMRIKKKRGEGGLGIRARATITHAKTGLGGGGGGLTVWPMAPRGPYEQGAYQLQNDQVPWASRLKS
jgi:hypothetical protein